MTGACSGDDPRTGPAGAGSNAKAIDASARCIQALRARFPEVLRREAGADPALDDGGWVQLPADLRRRAARSARVRLPARADSEVTVIDETSGLTASFRLVGGRPARGALVDGLFVFPAGGPRGSDVVLRVDGEGVEDYLAFDGPPPSPSVEYELDATTFASLRLVSDVLELVDAHGLPRLRVAPPWIVDARGTRHPAHLSVDGCAVDADPRPPWGRTLPAPGAAICRVSVHWEGAAVVYPALLDPKWGTTGSMFTPRRDHTATRLASGEVLMIGGFDVAGNGQTFAERYLPPPFGLFSVTGPMQIGRGLHTETMLAGAPERVLVTGGAASASGQVFGNAEIYDVTTGTFGATTIPMTEPRREHTATLLQSGRVLVAGGSQSAVEPRQAELFDPGTQQFSTTAGKMATGRHGHTAVGLPDGKVLVAGGFGTVFALATTELFDPGPATFSTGATMTSVRAYATATLLEDGRALLAGGTNGVLFYSTADVYDPTLASFTQTIPMAAARAHHAATILETGRVILTGGDDAGGAKDDTEAYDPTTGGFAGDATMNEMRTHHTATLLDSGKVLVAGGTVGAPASSAEVLLRANGDACAVDGECESSHCVLGMCCDTTCTGLCTACTADDKGSGVDGECGPVIAGKAAAGPGTIGCESDINFQIVCDGLGGVTSGTIKDCKPFACVGQACLDACNKPEDCTTTAWCRFLDNTCQPKSPNGASCGDGVECTSGSCADGVCCNAACDGSCEVCNRPEAPGTCGAAPAGPAPEGHPACSGTDPCVGVCDGNAVTCTFPPVACGDASTCTAGEQTSGVCQDGECAQVARSCEEFACDAEDVACRTSCKTTDECAQGFLCTADGKCAVVDAATCDGSVVRLPNGGTDDCAPFGCEAGACRTSCSSVNDCAASFVCDPAGRCVAPPSAPTLPDACSVVSVGAEGRRGPAALAALALLSLLARRRRSGGRAAGGAS